ncbi:hypothetical protein E2562_031525 [Oryza meyeriana var. granulata]|uniref:Uncharacterized protein n=1 Tax=Oryza meyeriana var. granulata TaxID=110450 RepID=A0A6G1DQR1_9ORYZ|nr:hypothetical protein E2562_031525 [Oryza meyeriana var. granulata]
MGIATAVAMIVGLMRRVNCRQYVPWLPLKLDEGMRQHVKLTLCLLHLQLTVVPDEEQSFELGAIKEALYHA